MAPVNWDSFASLPGSAESNFELLCRALIRLHYGQYGSFAALAAQPGVEFHLRLDADCSLGKAGRWYGWQCRWYDLGAGGALGGARRDKIKKALETTAREVPGITDWVLWTRRPLTKGDQQWFNGLTTSFRLYQWTAAEVESHLCGQAELLRGTYFGELVLTPDTLAQRHTESVAPIRIRWQPEVHRPVAAERALRAMLGETGSWEDLVQLASQLRKNADALEGMADVPAPFAGAAKAVVGFAKAVATALVNVHGAIGKGDLDHLRHETATRQPHLARELAELPRKLRGAGHVAALFATNVVADIRHASELFQRVEKSFGVCLVAVLADAGCGKTELSAQLTAAINGRPAGVLLHGRDLHAGQTLDALAQRFVLSGKPVPSMEALLAAVEAAGQRAKRRLPFVIDGLSESEDPRDWRTLLASLGATLVRYPHVLVVCTVRGAFADEAVPEELERLEIPDFGSDTVEAIRGYFRHYKIDASDADLPVELLTHPLTLRLFCEVTNPTKAKVVGVEAMPGSLSSLFDRYLEQASKRITELAPRTQRYYEQDVRAALDQIGAALWDNAARGLDVRALQRDLREEGRPWDQSLVRALEQEGIVLRIPSEGGASQVAPAFEALGGHLIADAILARKGQSGFGPWLQEPKTTHALVGPPEARHPLASDVVYALVGLCPRRLHRQQLWQLVDEPLRGTALRLAAELEATYLDAATVESLGVLLAAIPSRGSPELLDRLQQTRGASTHPLNAEFLDRTLRVMSVADRDLRWSEWVRGRSAELTDDLKWIAGRWRKGVRREGDELRARWVMWTLTSTVRELRDQSTNTLYWFGRVAPSELFTLTIDSLELNDPYVSERMLAASYGVVMAHQEPTAEFEVALASYLRGLAQCLTGPAATNPTGHWLARTYVRGVFDLAQARYPGALPPGVVGGEVALAGGSAIEPLPEGDSRAEEVRRTLHMDFENYTLGSLFEDRANYDMDHLGHREAVAHVQGIVWNLGWREASFETIDKDLSRARYLDLGDRQKAERYGKKYGWIGFHTYAGLLEDAKRLPRGGQRLPEVDIDPSFPEEPTPDPSLALEWLSPEVADDRAWIERGQVDLPDKVFRRRGLASYEGPWIAVQGFLENTNKMLGRRVVVSLAGIALASEHAQRIRAQLEAPGHPGVRVPEVPNDHYTFAGEIPWSKEFGARDLVGNIASLYREYVQLDRAASVELEIFGHRYAWESYHSSLNRAGGALVPSKLFAAAFDLRGLPQTFNQSAPDGSAAAITVGAPVGFDGEILYLREDLVRMYLAGRVLLWFIRGERQLYPFPHPVPKWLNDVRRDGLDTWRLTRVGDEISPVPIS